MSKPYHVAVMLDLESAYRRHTSIYAGTQEYAVEQGWETTIDEYADDTLPARAKKGTGPICWNGPKGASHKLDPSPFSPYDGVIARATKKLAQRAARLGVPIVNVWRSSAVRDQLPGVFPDVSAIGRMRAEHLLSRGFIRFAVLTSRNIGHALEAKAFRSTLGEAGYSCTVTMVPLDPAKTLARWRKTERIVAAWIDSLQPPIGVYVGSEDVGRIVAQMCRNRGLRVPVDVAITAGWNEAAFCEQPPPSLTSVELGGERIGYEAARLLHRLMDARKKPQRASKKKPPAPEHILLPPVGLVVRESTDFFAVDDELVNAALGFIAANSHLRIGPDEVAHAVSAETRTLQLHFRKHLKRPIAAEIRRVRIERAKRELAQSKRRLSEIARDVGFRETMRMYEVFRRELGVTPSQYRKQRQNPQVKGD